MPVTLIFFILNTFSSQSCTPTFLDQKSENKNYVGVAFGKKYVSGAITISISFWKIWQKSIWIYDNEQFYPLQIWL